MACADEEVYTPDPIEDAGPGAPPTYQLAHDALLDGWDTLRGWRGREVERAQADGRWEAAYDGQKTMQVPDDLHAALAAEPGALEFFETLRGQNRYAILYRVHDAKRPETRARRIATFVAMCAAGETVR